jgi:hypothetical protein
MVQRHVVIVSRQDGVVEEHPMKAWLRQHPEHMPPGIDSDPRKSNSHQLRTGLKRMGWTMDESSTQVQLFPPGEQSWITTLSEKEDEAPPADAVQTFAFETQLRDFIASNLHTIEIEGRKLSLFKGDNRDGVEYPTPVGRIDILAVDSEGSLYIFELKRAESPDQVMGQLARYMGWAIGTIGSGKKVFGIIVAKGIGEKIRYARLAVPNVYLFEYQVAFELTPAHKLSR